MDRREAQVFRGKNIRAIRVIRGQKFPLSEGSGISTDCERVLRFFTCDRLETGNLVDCGFNALFCSVLLMSRFLQESMKLSAGYTMQRVSWSLGLVKVGGCFRDRGVHSKSMPPRKPERTHSRFIFPREPEADAKPQPYRPPWRISTFPTRGTPPSPNCAAVPVVSDEAVRSCFPAVSNGKDSFTGGEKAD
jgi:hypothetical protein